MFIDSICISCIIFKASLQSVLYACHVDSATRNDYLTLDGQIQHKLAYISDHIPAGKRLIIIGHSIGCYMMLKMLSKDTDNSLVQFCSHCSVQKCYLLFPTIERMAQSPNGQFFTPLLKYFRWIIPLVTIPLLFLSCRVKRFLVERFFGVGQVSECAIEATVKLLSPAAYGNSVYLAHIEMQSVCKLDTETANRNIERLCFYYGTNDAWCPTEYYHSMKMLFPSGEIHLCQHDIQHAFVLKHSELMASIVSEWLQADEVKL